MQRRKAREGKFTVPKQQRFLDALALTCNIAKAARHIGVHPSTTYKARMRDAVFAKRMKAALEIGLDRLEALVMEHGGAGEPLDADPERAEAEGVEALGTGSDAVPPPPFDFDRAMEVLKYHRAVQVKAERPIGRRPVNATREETNAALMKALAAAHKRLAKAAAKEAVAMEEAAMKEAGMKEAGHGG